MKVKIKKIIKKRKKEAVLGTVFVFLFAITLWQAMAWKSDERVSKVPAVPAVSEVRRLLDGVWVEPGKDNPKIVGVMIENMIEAQPISGVADARLVFEAITEANITRFLAYFILPPPPPLTPPTRGGESFSNSSPLMGEDKGGGGVSEIGPVRSSRPYYLDFASEFNTLYAHVGSSPAAYEMLRKVGVEGVYDLDQWYAPEYFFSKVGRRRPHSLYTNMELLGEAYEKLVNKESRIKNYGFEAWLFKNDAPPDLRGNVTDIFVEYGEPYAVRWLYDKSENQYKRMQWGGAHTTADGKEIIAKNIAVAFQKMKVLDEIGRKEFTTIGEGAALVFQDGRVVVGKWEKLSPQERMRFYNTYEQEVEFNAGATWVEIVPDGYRISY